jgi:hypothetical protein
MCAFFDFLFSLTNSSYYIRICYYHQTTQLRLVLGILLLGVVLAQTDCSGTAGGTAVYDVCDVCNGDGTSARSAFFVDDNVFLIDSPSSRTTRFC